MKWVPILSGMAPTAEKVIILRLDGTYEVVTKKFDPVTEFHTYINAQGDNCIKLGPIVAFMEMPECPEEIIQVYIEKTGREYQKMHDGRA